MDGQISLFDYNREQKKKNLPEWGRICHNEKCGYADDEHICTSTYKCEKRMNYKTLNTYYVEQLGHKGLINPVDGIHILCDANKEDADELIRKYREYFGK